MKLVTFEPRDPQAVARPGEPARLVSRCGVLAERAGEPDVTAPILDLPVALAYLESRAGRPADPASDRKQGVSAVKRRGRVGSGTICSRTRFVSETSAVGMSQRPSVV